MGIMDSFAEQNIVAFIYARSDSTRLPGKVFLPLGENSLIEIVLKRARASLVNEVVLLTTERSIDDKLVKKAKQLNFEVIRGDAHDLVSRTLYAIDILKPNYFVRINADSPFFDPRILNFIIKNKLKYDVITNLINRTFPYGVAVEVINCDYYNAMANFVRNEEKEHVTQHIYRTIKKANLIHCEQLNNHSHLRLTIDNKEDYQNIEKLWDRMENYFASYWEVLGLSEPNLALKS